jgi:hypothetical protein
MPLTRPPCPKCATTMMLARRQPSKDGLEKRIFERPKCNGIVQFLVGSDDPMDKVGRYLSSDLKPPVSS